MGHLFGEPVDPSVTTAPEQSLRANAAATLRFGNRIERIAGGELNDDDERAGVLLHICRKYPAIFRRYFKVDPEQVTLDHARDFAARYPVFRLQPAGEADNAPTSLSAGDRTP